MIKKIRLTELLYDIERTKDWEGIHNLIMTYSDSFANEKITPNIFDELWWDDFINSVNYGEILDDSVKNSFFAGL